VLAVLVGTHRIELWHVASLAVILGVVNAFDNPTRQAFMFELVGKDDLMNAIALNSSSFNAARVIGPAIAGILIGAVGLALCYFLNALSYVAVIWGLLAMRLPPFVRPERTGPGWDDSAKVPASSARPPRPRLGHDDSDHQWSSASRSWC